MRDLAGQLGQIAGDHFDLIVPAFLELAEPDIAAGIEQCVEAGASSVTAVPYFLAAGRHVVTDIPNELNQAAHQHPAVSIVLSDYLGMHESLRKILLTLASDRTEAGASPHSVR